MVVLQVSYLRSNWNENKKEYTRINYVQLNVNNESILNVYLKNIKLQRDRAMGGRARN